LDYLRQVQRGIDYLEDRLDVEIELGDVARHAGISQWHFQRIFKALTNETLKTYIRARRLANALDKLATTDARVIEIALAAGFETQESFTRAFKKAFGVAPATYRRRKRDFPFVRKIRFDAEYLSHIHANVSLEPELYLQPEMNLIGMSTRFFSVDSEKNNIADKLPGLWSAFLARLGEIQYRIQGCCYGVVQQTPEKTDELEYLAGVAVTDARARSIPPGMRHLCVRASRYAKFAHRGEVQKVDQTVNYIYSSWLARSGMRHTYAADLEFYGPQYHPDSEQSVIHYAIPVTSATS
jgi:AraC family transcriptional regulator